MKKLVFLILLIPLFFACNNEDPKPMISGVADHVENNFFVLGGPSGTRDTVYINEENVFSFDPQGLTVAANYYLLVGTDFFTFYLAPDMQLDIYFDQNNFMESLNFAGIGSDINNYLADKTRKFGAIMDYSVFEREPLAFKTWADSTLSAKQSFLSEQEPADPSAVFWVTEEAEILYEYVGLMQQYPQMFTYYTKVEELELPEGFNAYKEGLDINRADYLKSWHYTQYVSAAITEATQDAMKSAPEDADRNMVLLETAVKMVDNIEVRNNFLSSRVKGRMQWNDLADFDAEYADWKKLATGEPAIEFEGKDTEGNTIKLSDFSGK